MRVGRRYGLCSAMKTPIQTIRIKWDVFNSKHTGQLNPDHLLLFAAKQIEDLLRVFRVLGPCVHPHPTGYGRHCATTVDAESQEQIQLAHNFVRLFTNIFPKRFRRMFKQRLRRTPRRDSQVSIWRSQKWRPILPASRRTP
jgi:hypothetical protein